jgi:hypothetical protein
VPIPFVVTHCYYPLSVQRELKISKLLEQRPKFYVSNLRTKWKIGVSVPFIVTHGYYPLSVQRELKISKLLEQRPKFYVSKILRTKWKIGVSVPFVVTHGYYPLSIPKKVISRERGLVKTYKATSFLKNI